MATIPLTKGKAEERNHAAWLVHSWANMANGDDGEPVELGFMSDRTVQVAGTFGVGGSVLIEGSLNGINWVPLTDPQGNQLAISAAKAETVMELVKFIRPRVSAGDGTTALNVFLLLAGRV